ncbi:ribbon-helix-helix protein, CopG family [Streptomyces sp. NPDC059862]|uniref:ribbon-helix-helix protein, CopG family n=1 Tax=Streptomyces sp. NPDC059862 TaxID=3346975 RepID=UPI00364CD031
MTAKERVTVSLPADKAAALQQLAKDGRIESVSAYVSEAVEERMGREERAQRIIEGWAHEAEQQDPQAWEQALAWARQSDQRGQHVGGAAA